MGVEVVTQAGAHEHLKGFNQVDAKRGAVTSCTPLSLTNRRPCHLPFLLRSRAPSHVLPRACTRTRTAAHLDLEACAPEQVVRALLQAALGEAEAQECVGVGAARRAPQTMLNSMFVSIHSTVCHQQASYTCLLM